MSAMVTEHISFNRFLFPGGNTTSLIHGLQDSGGEITGAHCPLALPESCSKQIFCLADLVACIDDFLHQASLSLSPSFPLPSKCDVLKSKAV